MGTQANAFNFVRLAWGTWFEGNDGIENRLIEPEIFGFGLGIFAKGGQLEDADGGDSLLELAGAIFICRDGEITQADQLPATTGTAFD